MTSLADELDLDPAFHDVTLDNNGGVPLSFQEEEETDISFEGSPPRKRAGRGGGRSRRGNSNEYSSDEAEQQGPSGVGMNEGFSLADELGGGSDRPVVTVGSTLADEVGERGEDGTEDDLSRVELVDDEAKARKDREHYLSSSESLNESLRMTKAFLANLKATSSVLIRGDLNHSLSSATSNTSLNGTGAHSDDTSTLELRGGHILKQMREYSNIREVQIRELQEFDRILRRAFEEGGDWFTALANVDDFEGKLLNEDSREEDDTLAFISKPQLSKLHSSSDTTMAANTLALADEEEPSLAISPGFVGRLPLSNLSGNNQRVYEVGQSADNVNPTICQQLASLRHSTLDVVGSLASIHEQSQVAQASMNDAARRIKTIKTVLSKWSAEIEAAEQSQSHIQSWESGGDETIGLRPKDIRQWTVSHMDKFHRILNDAEMRARELLSPVHDSILDQLAVQG